MWNIQILNALTSQPFLPSFQACVSFILVLLILLIYLALWHYSCPVPISTQHSATLMGPYLTTAWFESQLMPFQLLSLLSSSEKTRQYHNLLRRTLIIYLLTARLVCCCCSLRSPPHWFKSHSHFSGFHCFINSAKLDNMVIIQGLRNWMSEEGWTMWGREGQHEERMISMMGMSSNIGQ